MDRQFPHTASFDPDKQLGIENSTSDPSIEPVETTRGINKRGNRWTREDYGDQTDRYWYNNRNGTYYEKHPDGTAEFKDPRRGVEVYFPAPVPNEQIRHEEHDARDMSSGYPSTSQRSKTHRSTETQNQESAKFRRSF